MLAAGGCVSVCSVFGEELCVCLSVCRSWSSAAAPRDYDAVDSVERGQLFDVVSARLGPAQRPVRRC